MLESRSLVAILLVGVVLACGLAAYWQLSGFTARTDLRICIESAEAVKAADSVAFAITVKNVGNAPIVRLTVSLDGAEVPVPSVSSSAPLEPGRTAAAAVQFPNGRFVAGQTYAFTVVATAADGSTAAATGTVVVR